MAFGAYIFDLDGTLLDTLPDLVNLTNMVLREYGAPERTTDEVNSFVGAGAHVLLQRAFPARTPDEIIDEAFDRWKQLYPQHGHRFTKPYPGMPETLARLKGRGAKLGVLSNKFDAAVREVIGIQFPEVFDLARGECAEIPRKPDPAGLLWMLENLGVEPGDSAYVGDSAGDMAVALAAGSCPIGVAWGYRNVDELRQAGAWRIVGSPEALLDIA